MKYTSINSLLKWVRVFPPILLLCPRDNIFYISHIFSLFAQGSFFFSYFFIFHSIWFFSSTTFQLQIKIASISIQQGYRSPSPFNKVVTPFNQTASILVQSGHLYSFSFTKTIQPLTVTTTSYHHDSLYFKFNQHQSLSLFLIFNLLYW